MGASARKSAGPCMSPTPAAGSTAAFQVIATEAQGAVRLAECVEPAVESGAVGAWLACEVVRGRGAVGRIAARAELPRDGDEQRARFAAKLRDSAIQRGRLARLVHGRIFRQAARVARAMACCAVVGARRSRCAACPAAARRRPTRGPRLPRRLLRPVSMLQRGAYDPDHEPSRTDVRSMYSRWMHTGRGPRGGAPRAACRRSSRPARCRRR